MKSFGTLLAGALCAAAITVSGSVASAATTLFTDLGPGQSYGLGGQRVTEESAPAFSFVAMGSGSVAEIDIALVGQNGTSSLISLWTDSGGALGAELGSWTVSDLPNGSGGLATVTGISGIELTAGDTYFLQAGPTNAQLGWETNNQGVTGILWTRGIENSGATIGAFDILGSSAVPEPATWAMLFLGVAMVGLAARRRAGGVARCTRGQERRIKRWEHEAVIEAM
jgi:PEP-CTERM motif